MISVGLVCLRLVVVSTVLHYEETDKAAANATAGHTVTRWEDQGRSPSQVRLFDPSAAPPRTTPHSDATFRWLYAQNPNLDAGQTSFYLFEKDGLRRGHLGTIPTRIWTPPGALRAQFLSDLWFDTASRGQGYATALLRHVVESKEASLLVGMTPPAYRRYARLGYQVLGEIERQVAFPALSLMLARPSSGSQSVSISRGIPPAEDLDLFWQSIRTSYAAIPDRSARAVAWRVFDYPRGHYVVLAAWATSTLRGYAVLACYHATAGLRLGSLVDVTTANGDHEAFEALIHAAMRVFAANGVAIVRASFSHGWARTQLARCGFWSQSRFRSARSRRLHTAFLATPEGRPAPLPPRLDEWFLTRFDAEADLVEATLRKPITLSSEVLES